MRWGYEVIRNNSDKGKYGNGKRTKGKELCGATGMGVWINKTINVESIKQLKISGVNVSCKLIEHLEKVKTNESVEEIEGEIILLGQ